MISSACLTPPKLPREPAEQRFQLGDTLKVKIPISGKGPYTFKVKKDDQSPVDNDRVRIQEHDDHIVVTIPGSCFSNRFFSLDRHQFLLQISNAMMQESMLSMLPMILAHAMSH